MKTDAESEPNRFKERLAFVKSILEVVAILLAGVWALFNFKVKDAPTLQQSLTSSPGLRIEEVRPNVIAYTYNVLIKNIGKTTFDIDSMRISIWKVKKEDILSKTPFMVEDYMAIHPVPFITYSSNNSHLIRSYSPEQDYSADYCFFLPKDTVYGILFYHEVFGTGKSWFSREKLMDRGSRWELDPLRRIDQ